MRANYKMQRLYVEDDLVAGQSIEPAQQAVHYLLNVLRMKEGAEVLLFNGRDGEWKASLMQQGKKRLLLTLQEKTRPQPVASRLIYCFAPLKQGRLDYMIQKAVEMGVGELLPVLTQHTQMHKLAMDRVRANAIEAAEQCGNLALPHCHEPVRFERFMDEWDRSNPLIFCDEGDENDNPLIQLQALSAQSGKGSVGVLIGPEGGFSDEERRQLRAASHVKPIPLGPRILRADTAAVAALTLVQATLGDW